jgi:hypothetical protein
MLFCKFLNDAKDLARINVVPELTARAGLL